MFYPFVCRFTGGIIVRLLNNNYKSVCLCFCMYCVWILLSARLKILLNNSPMDTSNKKSELAEWAIV